MKVEAMVIRDKFKIERDVINLPQVPPDYIRAKVYKTGICGTDIEMFKGTLPYLKDSRISYPIVPGHEWSGKIVKTGSEVSDLKEGDRVSGELHVGCGKCYNCKAGNYNICLNLKRIGIGDFFGSFARYIQLPEVLVHKIPAKIDFTNATLIEPTAVALKGLSYLEFTGGERTIIFGTGAIGLMAVNVCRIYGAGEITLVSRRESILKKEIGHRLGADKFITFEQVDKDMINNFDVGVEASGGNKVLPSLFDLIRPGGQLSLIGIPENPVDNVEMSRIVTKNIAIYGSLGSAGVWDNVIELIEKGYLNPGLLISHEFYFEDLGRVLNNIKKLKDNDFIKASIIMEDNIDDKK